MNFRCVAFSCVLLVVSVASSASADPELIGQSKGGTKLNVSPDGKWLLSWDGIIINEPGTNSGQRLVWNLATKTARDLSQWSKTTTIEDAQCEFTPDNRILFLKRNPTPMGDMNPAFTPTIYIQKPDGTGKIVCHDSSPNVHFDADSQVDDTVGFAFAGKQLCLLTGSFFRYFDAHTGKLLFRRRLGSRVKAERSESIALSPDGKQIFSFAGEKLDANGTKLLKTGTWRLFDARSGRLLRQIPHPTNVRFMGFSKTNVFTYRIPQFDVSCRLSDNKVLWKRAVPTQTPMPTQQELVVTDAETGKTLAYRPPVGAWVDIEISPDRKQLYTINTEGQIYAFPAVAQSRSEAGDNA